MSKLVILSEMLGRRQLSGSPLSSNQTWQEGRQKHQTEITLFLPAVYLHRDEGSLKQRPKGHSAGPCLMLLCDKGFCFVSYRFFLACLLTWEYSQWAKVQRGTEGKQRWQIYCIFFKSRSKQRRSLHHHIWGFCSHIRHCGVLGTQRGQADVCRAILAHAPLKSSPKGFSHSRLRGTEKCPTQPSISTPSLLYLPPLYPAPIPAPLPWPLPCSPLRLWDNGSLSKKSRKREEPGVTELPVCWRNL